MSGTSSCNFKKLTVTGDVYLSNRPNFVHQHGHRFIVLAHQHGHHVNMLQGFIGVITHMGCRKNTRKACKSRAARRVVYKLFESLNWQTHFWKAPTRAGYRIRRAKRRKHILRKEKKRLSPKSSEGID